MDKKTCSHVKDFGDVKPNTDGCGECLKEGTTWVQLRLCMECGHVGCCDSSVGKHATKHFQATKHPVMKDLPEGNSWMWCYIDKIYIY